MDLKSVTKIQLGKASSVFGRSTAKTVPDVICFSVCDSSRTLDVQTGSEEQRDLWVKCIKMAILYLREQMRKKK